MVAATKPSVVVSFLSSLLALLVFYLLIFSVGLVLALAYALLQIIPLLGDFIVWFVEERGDGAAVLLPYFSFILSYFLSRRLVERLNKHLPTRRLTFALLGVYIIVLNSIFIILNIIDGLPWAINIGYIITGIVFLYKSHSIVIPNTKPEPSSTSTPRKTPSKPTAYLMDAASGRQVWVPADRIDEWTAAQERLKKGEHSLTSAQRKEITDRIVRDFYGAQNQAVPTKHPLTSAPPSQTLGNLDHLINSNLRYTDFSQAPTGPDNLCKYIWARTMVFCARIDKAVSVEAATCVWTAFLYSTVKTLHNKDALLEISAHFLGTMPSSLSEQEDAAKIALAQHRRFLSVLNASNIQPFSNDADIKNIWTITASWAFPHQAVPADSLSSFAHNLGLLVTRASYSYPI